LGCIHDTRHEFKHGEAEKTWDQAGIVDEFRIVRLDEFGTIDVNRIFSYDGVDKMIDNGITLIAAYFTPYPRLRRPNTGKEMAEDRYRWIVERACGN